VWNEKTRRELLGLALLALALFTLLSLIPLGGARSYSGGNIMGLLGAAFAARGSGVFGVGIWAVPAVLTLLGARQFDWLTRDRAIRWPVLLGGLALLVPVSVALLDKRLAAGSPAGATEGWLGKTLAIPMIALLSPIGAAILIAFLYAALVVLTLGWNPITAAARNVGLLWPKKSAKVDAVVVPVPSSRADEEDIADSHDDGQVGPVAVAPDTRAERKSAERGAKKAKTRPDPILQDFGDPESTDRPPLTLLTQPPPQNTSLTETELDRLGQVVIQTLRTFKVEGCEIGGRTTGPVVTQFEVVPGPGVKVNRIAALDADLALALKAPSVRIVAPIPGKGAVGVDVPNPERVAFTCAPSESHRSSAKCVCLWRWAATSRGARSSPTSPRCRTC
jgi:S-DNA-T family DNA segregation ATPase FtsK/SpoIIIE